MAEKEYIEYIERGALLNDIEEIRPLNWTDTEAEITEQADFDWFENLVKSQPIADVVEVVRCKDCKFFKTDTFGQKICIRQFNTIKMNDNDFCSYGEKKCGDGNG